MKHSSYFFAFVIATFLIVSGCATVPKSQLIKASANNDFLAVQKLINEGANINEPDSNGYTPLHYAVSNGNYKLVKMLVDNGANVNAKDAVGTAPLHIYGCNYEMAKLLVDNGANINAQDKTGATKLHYVAQAYAGKDGLMIAEYLLDKNANTSLKDAEGLTALRHAILYKNVDLVALIRKKTNSLEETETLSMNEALGKPSHYEPEKGMFDVPADKEKIYKIAVYDCNLMVTFDKGKLTMITGPIGYLGSMAADAVVIKGKFQKCMAKMGFECKNNCSK